MILCKLFWEFCKTGLFAIGGGMATVPFLREIADKTGWFTAGQLADMIAVSESTPGPLGVNMATYVGYTVGLSQLGSPWMGIVGAVTATLGLIFPSIVIVLCISFFLKRFRTSTLVDAALYGLRPASVALISAGWKLCCLPFCGWIPFIRLGRHSSAGNRWRWPPGCTREPI